MGQGLQRAVNAARATQGKSPAVVKPPTAQAVSALLRAAGFDRAESTASRIKGQRNWSDGYQVSALSGEVKVRHMTFRHAGAGDEKRQMLARYADAIREARPAWVVTGPEPDGFLGLTVTAAGSEASQ